MIGKTRAALPVGVRGLGIWPATLAGVVRVDWLKTLESRRLASAIPSLVMQFE